MVKKLKSFFSKNYIKIIISIVIFLFFLIMYRIVPMMYDGWGGKFYYNDSNGFFNHVINIFTDYYSGINGRIASNIFCGILESFSSEWPLDILNSLLYCSIFLLLFSFIDKKKKISNFMFGLSFVTYMSLILTMSAGMRKEVLFYANMSYIVPFLLILIFYKILKTKPLNMKYIIILSIIGFSIGTWMEHISIGFISVISLFWLYDFFRGNKKYKELIIPIIVTIIGFGIMMLSPGLRTNREITSSLSLFSTIKKSFSSIYSDVVSDNLYLTIFLYITMIGIMLKTDLKKKINKVILVLDILFLVALIIAKVNLFGNVSLLNKITYFFSPDGNINSFYGSVLSSIFILFSLCYCIMQCKQKELMFILLGIMIFSLAPLCISVNLGPRISSVGFYILLFISILILLELDIKNNIYKKMLITVLSIFSFYAIDKTIIMLKHLSEVDSKRKTIINSVLLKQYNGEWNFDDYAIIPHYEHDYILYDGAVGLDSFHYQIFLKAYDLDPRTKVIFSNSPVSGLVSRSDGELKIEMINDTYDVTEYKYILTKYIDKENRIWVNEIDWTTESSGSFEVEKESSYKIEFYYKMGENIYKGDGYLDSKNE